MKRLSPRTRNFIAAFIGITPFVLGGYAACVEPRWLEVTEHSIELPVAAPLTIAHVSDMHLRRIGAVETATLDAIAAAHPDLIVVTGDLFDRASAKTSATEFLSRLQAPLGVWYVPGNWEHWVDPEAQTPGIATTSAGLLINRAAEVRGDLWIVGLDDALAGTPRPDEALSNVPVGVATLALFHSPAFFSRIADRIDLGLAGHTHGGQIRVPFVGAIVTPSGSGPYVHGWYREGRASLYVSRGIGMTILPLRFACRPELAIIRVKPKM